MNCLICGHDGLCKYYGKRCVERKPPMTGHLSSVQRRGIEVFYGRRIRSLDALQIHNALRSMRGELIGE